MPKKILIADDSITIQKVVAMAFEGEDFEVIPASDGNAAYEKALSLSPDVVLADIEMSDLDGFDLSKKIKTTPSLNETQVILLTSDFDELDMDRFKESLAYDFLPKPFKSEDLIAKVEACINAKPLQDETPMETLEVSGDDWSDIELAVMDLPDQESEPTEGETLKLSQDQVVSSEPKNEPELEGNLEQLGSEVLEEPEVSTEGSMQGVEEATVAPEIDLEESPEQTDAEPSEDFDLSFLNEDDMEEDLDTQEKDLQAEAAFTTTDKSTEDLEDLRLEPSAVYEPQLEDLNLKPIDLLESEKLEEARKTDIAEKETEVFIEKMENKTDTVSEKIEIESDDTLELVETDDEDLEELSHQDEEQLFVEDDEGLDLSAVEEEEVQEEEPQIQEKDVQEEPVIMAEVQAKEGLEDLRLEPSTFPEPERNLDEDDSDLSFLDEDEPELEAIVKEDLEDLCHEASTVYEPERNLDEDEDDLSFLDEDSEEMEIAAQEKEIEETINFMEKQKSDAEEEPDLSSLEEDIPGSTEEDYEADPGDEEKEMEEMSELVGEMEGDTEEIQSKTGAVFEELELEADDELELIETDDEDLEEEEEEDLEEDEDEAEMEVSAREKEVEEAINLMDEEESDAEEEPDLSSPEEDTLDSTEQTIEKTEFQTETLAIEPVLEDSHEVYFGEQVEPGELEASKDEGTPAKSIEMVHWDAIKTEGEEFSVEIEGEEFEVKEEAISLSLEDELHKEAEELPEMVPVAPEATEEEAPPEDIEKLCDIKEVDTFLDKMVEAPSLTSQEDSPEKIEGTGLSDLEVDQYVEDALEKIATGFETQVPHIKEEVLENLSWEKEPQVPEISSDLEQAMANLEKAEAIPQEEMDLGPAIEKSLELINAIQVPGIEENDLFAYDEEEGGGGDDDLMEIESTDSFLEAIDFNKEYVIKDVVEKEDLEPSESKVPPVDLLEDDVEDYEEEIPEIAEPEKEETPKVEEGAPAIPEKDLSKFEGEVNKEIVGIEAELKNLSPFLDKKESEEETREIAFGEPTSRDFSEKLAEISMAASSHQDDIDFVMELEGTGKDKKMGHGFSIQDEKISMDSLMLEIPDEELVDMESVEEIIEEKENLLEEMASESYWARKRGSGKDEVEKPNGDYISQVTNKILQDLPTFKEFTRKAPAGDEVERSFQKSKKAEETGSGLDEAMNVYLKGAIEKVVKEALQNDVGNLAGKIAHSVEEITKEITPGIRNKILNDSKNLK